MRSYLAALSGGFLFLVAGAASAAGLTIHQLPGGDFWYEVTDKMDPASQRLFDYENPLRTQYDSAGGVISRSRSGSLDLATKLGRPVKNPVVTTVERIASSDLAKLGTRAARLTGWGALGITVGMALYDYVYDRNKQQWFQRTLGDSYKEQSLRDQGFTQYSDYCYLPGATGWPNSGETLVEMYRNNAPDRYWQYVQKPNTSACPTGEYGYTYYKYKTNGPDYQPAGTTFEAVPETQVEGAALNQIASTTIGATILSNLDKIAAVNPALRDELNRTVDPAAVDRTVTGPSEVSSSKTENITNPDGSTQTKTTTTTNPLTYGPGQTVNIGPTTISTTTIDHTTNTSTTTVVTEDKSQEGEQPKTEEEKLKNPGLPELPDAPSFDDAWNKFKEGALADGSFLGMISGLTIHGSGACPTASFEAFGQTYSFDYHCTLFEQIAGILGAAMMLVYAVTSVYLVMRA